LLLIHEFHHLSCFLFMNFIPTWSSSWWCAMVSWVFHTLFHFSTHFFHCCHVHCCSYDCLYCLNPFTFSLALSPLIFPHFHFQHSLLCLSINCLFHFLFLFCFSYLNLAKSSSSLELSILLSSEPFLSSSSPSSIK